MRFALTVLGVTAALIGVAGCGGDATAPQDHVKPRELTTAERDLLADAEEGLVRECMRDAGFKMYAAGSPAPAADLPFGNDDAAYARKHGLGLGETDLGRYRARHPNMRYFKSLSQQQQREYAEAMDGNPGENDVAVKLPTGFVVKHSKDGCSASAQERLYGDFARWFEVQTRVESLPSAYMPKVFDAAKYRTALKAWSDCMHGNGHSAKNPGALRDRFLRAAEANPAQASPSDAEIEAAVTEARCGDRTDLVRVGNDLQEHYSDQAYEKHRNLVLDYQEMSVAALAKARQLTGEIHG